MAHPIEWIPKCGNHPEESAGSEYTASPAGFSRGRGDFGRRAICMAQNLTRFVGPGFRPAVRDARRSALQAAEKPIFCVILSEAKNLFLM